MIRNLRLHLTCLMATLTSLVLAGALLVTWRFSEQQYQRSAEELFYNIFSSLCDRLADADTVTDTWLSEQERSTGCLIFLRDNGAALHYRGALKSQTPRNELEALALENAALTLDFSQRDNQGAMLRQKAYCMMSGSMDDTYFTAMALLPRRQDASYLLAVSLQDTAFLQQHKYQSALLYAGLWMAGSILLALISYWLTGKALAPTAQALRQQKEFIAAASHELKSPLAVIKTSLQAVDENALSPDRQRTLLRSALAEVNRMGRLTDDLLLLANGDLDHIPAHLEALAPDNLCIEMYDRFFLLAQASGHPLAISLPETPVPSIQADEERLRQLLAILLNNALEHTPVGTPIELNLAFESPGTAVVIAVVDHGPGIPDALKAQVFERFFRADTSRTNKRNFGLGLSVARELARLHRATLTVTDTPGGGVTFSLAFPCR